MTEPEMKTYEATTAQGRMRFTVPASYKVTFGAIVPGTKSAYESGGAYGLRVWESAGKQHMVMAGVTSFRDLSIPVQIEAVRKFGDPEDAWYFDDGTYQDALDKGLIHKEWRPIDEVREGRLDVPKDPSDDDDADPGIAYAPKALRGMATRRNRSF